MDEGDRGLVPVFKVEPVYNEAETKKQGRPIYDEREIVEIRFSGDRNRVSVFPAHDISANVTQADGTSEPITYAQRFSEQYKRFKANKQQAVHGTPLEELTFLTAAKRSELKALNIYTAEQLANLDSTPLKNLGMGGREMKNQAQAYLEAAANTAEPTRLAAENEDLRAQLASMQSQIDKAAADSKKAKPAKPANAAADEDEEKPAKASEFADWPDTDLKEYIKSKTGAAPKGNPSHETLVGMAEDAA